MTFQTSDDLPFKLHGGDSLEAARYNRIAAINRINYLIHIHYPDFDLRARSEEYLKALDLEMYKKYYQNEPKDKKIDEEFCQRVAEFCVEMQNEAYLPTKKFLEKNPPAISELVYSSLVVDKKKTKKIFGTFNLGKMFGKLR